MAEKEPKDAGAEETQLRAVQQAAEEEGWEPSEEQVRFAFATMRMGVDTAVKDRARKASVKVRDARRWLKDEEFVLWMTRALKHAKVTRLKAVWNAIFEKATIDRDMRAAELYIRRFDPDVPRAGPGEGGGLGAASQGILDLMAEKTEEERDFDPFKKG